jgi:NADH-quinone oxidoreductase subunit N
MAIWDLRGLGRRHPVPALLFGLFLLSLAGLPPTAGFWAKLAVFSAGVDAGFTWLVVVGVVSSVIAFFFYIRVIVAMFLEEEPAALAEGPPLVTPAGAGVALAAATAAIAVLSLAPGTLLEVARQAASFAG